MAGSITTSKLVDLDILKYYDQKQLERENASDATTLSSAKSYTDEQIQELSDLGLTYIIKKLATPESGYLASYQLYNVDKDGKETAIANSVVNIPKDFLVKSADLKTATEDIKDSEDNILVAKGHKYIDFVVNSVDGTAQESHIYLDVETLFSDYEGDGKGVTIDNHVIKLIAATQSTADADVVGITGADYKALEDAVNAIAVSDDGGSSVAGTGVNSTTSTKVYTLSGTTVDGAAVAVTETISVVDTTYDVAVAPVTGENPVSAKNGLMTGEEKAAVAKATTDISTINTITIPAAQKAATDYADGLDSAMNTRVSAIEGASFCSEADINEIFNPTVTE